MSIETDENEIKDIDDIEALIRSGAPDSEIEAKLERLYVGIPHSDVPFTYKIGQWREPVDIEIVSLNCEANNPNLHLLNIKFLLQIQITGRVKYKKEFRPKIGKIHITESIIHRKLAIVNGQIRNIGKIVLQPLIDVMHDPEYADEWVSFDIHQELILESMDWGRNIYIIKCGKFMKEVEVFQRK